MARLFLASLLLFSVVPWLTTAQQQTVQRPPQLQQRAVQGQPQLQQRTVQGQQQLQQRTVQGQPQLQQRTVQGQPQLQQRTVKEQPQLQQPTVQGQSQLQQGAVQGEPQLQQRVVQGQPQLQQRAEQGQLQQRRGVQERFQRRGSVQGQPQQRAVQGSSQQKGTPSSFLELIPDDLPLSKLTDQHLLGFLENEEGVNILTACFLNPKTCKNRSALNLIKQVRNLGDGGHCFECTEAERDYLADLVYRFLSTFVNKYPKQWRQVLPQIGRFFIHGTNY